MKKNKKKKKTRAEGDRGEKRSRNEIGRKTGAVGRI